MQTTNWKDGLEEQENKLKEKLTERLMDKLANLSKSDSKKSNVGKGLGQTPAPATLDISSQWKDLRIADKKGNQVHEPFVELESQEPKIFKNQKVEQQMIMMELKDSLQDMLFVPTAIPTAGRQ
ncbi:hypothetical protein PIB30_000334 [Stylosanthes scabra]|uniref:Uncharacterized protein n=1 Tax=Stylosanthes scabra TaxID=79078 RepID=A0ABU6T329_9FABA|nr:hypothetical protein [Stylosanthes scabra]